MKKVITALMLLLLIATSLVGCGNKDADKNSNDKNKAA